MGKKIERLTILWVCAFFVLISAKTASAVDVYAEGAYTDTDLHVYIYADIEEPALVSYGVKLTYDTDLLESTDPAPQAEKNDAVWYFGTTADKKTYMDPELDTSGNIIFIGGKLDTGDPLEGVSGDRVLLGTAVFTRKDGAAAPTDSSISLSIGREGGDYKNFVRNNEDVVDGDVAFSVKVRERGDANADNRINSADVSTIKYYLKYGGDFHVWMDCNEDSRINSSDVSCIKYKLKNL